MLTYGPSQFSRHNAFLLSQHDKINNFIMSPIIGDKFLSKN